MVCTERTGAATGKAAARGAAEYYASQMDVPEMAARLSAYLGERYGPGISGGTAAIPMPDMHPLVANVLGIDPTRALTIEEMTNLLAGYRVDGEPIPGRQSSGRRRIRFGWPIRISPSQRRRVSALLWFLLKQKQNERGWRRAGCALTTR